MNSVVNPAVCPAYGVPADTEVCPVVWSSIRKLVFSLVPLVPLLYGRDRWWSHIDHNDRCGISRRRCPVGNRDAGLRGEGLAVRKLRCLVHQAAQEVGCKGRVAAYQATFGERFRRRVSRASAIRIAN
jgi:hypothetical protein